MRVFRESKGATPLDVLVLVGCAVLMINVLSRVPDLIDYSYRKSCYQNRALLRAALHDIVQEQQEEIFHVAVAYAIRSNSPTRKSRIVVLFVPRPGAVWNRLVVRDIPESLLPRNLSCPVHSAADRSTVTIDYAYLLGSWRCLHEETHN